MIKTKKREALRKELHAVLHTLPRLRGGCLIGSGYVETGIFYEATFAEATELKGLMAEELGDRGYLKLEYNKKKTLTLTVAFSWGKQDEEYKTIRQVFYEDVEDQFEGYEEEDRPYTEMVFVNMPNANMTRIEYRLIGIEREDIAKRLDRLLDYVTNGLDIYSDIREGNI